MVNAESLLSNCHHIGNCHHINFKLLIRTDSLQNCPSRMLIVSLTARGESDKYCDVSIKNFSLL